MRHTAILQLGSNLGDSVSLCREAAAQLDSHDGISLNDQSSIYRSEPWGNIDQPLFVNQLVEVSTLLPPYALLSACLSVEHKLGRVRKEKWEARAMDVDILYYDNMVVIGPDLKIPHPYMANRRFILQMLADFRPDWVHPILRLTSKQLLLQCKDELNVTSIDS